MIELGIFNNQSTDLAPVLLEGGRRVPGGTLSDMHESMQRLPPSQVRQAVLAEQLGFHYWFQSEHHFQVEGAEFNPNPLITQAAIAVLTKRIRLGQLANILTWHQPLRLAEMAGAVDCLSGGRLEMGVGRGYQPRETESLGYPHATVQDQEKNRALFEESVEILIKAWTQPSMSHRGEFYSLPPSWTKWNHPQTIAYYDRPGIGTTLDAAMKVGPPDPAPSFPPITAGSTTLKELSVFPQPVQKPYPQMWMPLTSPRTIQWAAGAGVNGAFIAEPLPLVKSRIDWYMDAAEKAGWPDRLGRGEFKRGWDSEKRRGLVFSRGVYATDKGIGDLEKYKAGVDCAWQFYSGFGFNFLFADDNGKIPGRITFDMLTDSGVYLVGSKQQIIDGIMLLKETGGFDDFNFLCWFEHPGLAFEDVAEQMTYFAEEIMPVLQKECGGSPDFPESGLAFDQAYGPLPVG